MDREKNTSRKRSINFQRIKKVMQLHGRKRKPAGQKLQINLMQPVEFNFEQQKT